MGKIVEVLKGVTLPPEVESQVRILDLQYEALERKYAELVHEADTLRMVDYDETHEPQQTQGAGEIPRYTTQKLTNPNEPTPDELVILRLFQPRQEIQASAIARHLGLELIKATARLNELETKKYLSRRSRMGRYGRSTPGPRYHLTDLGVKYLAEH